MVSKDHKAQDMWNYAINHQFCWINLMNSTNPSYIKHQTQVKRVTTTNSDNIWSTKELNKMLLKVWCPKDMKNLLKYIENSTIYVLLGGPPQGADSKFLFWNLDETWWADSSTKMITRQYKTR